MPIVWYVVSIYVVNEKKSQPQSNTSPLVSPQPSDS